MRFEPQAIKQVKSGLAETANYMETSAREAWERGGYDSSTAASFIALNANIERLILVLENGIQVSSVALEDLPASWLS